MDYAVHEIPLARILDWVAFPFSCGSSQPRDQTQVSHISSGFFTSWAQGKPRELGIQLIPEYTKSPMYQHLCCEHSKLQTCIPSTAGVSEVAACPQSRVADDPSALPPPTSSPSSSQWLFLPIHSMTPLDTSCCTGLLYFSRHRTLIFKMLYFLCLFFMYCLYGYLG